MPGFFQDCVRRGSVLPKVCEALRRDQDVDPRDQRRADEVLIFGAPLRGATLGEQLDLLWDRVLTGLMAQTGPMGPAMEERRQAMHRLGEVMGMEPAERLKAIRRPPYRSLALARAFLEESTRAQVRYLDLSIDMARLALAITDRFRSRKEVAEVSAIRTRACCLEGNALRLRGDWEAADQRFAAAFRMMQVTAPDVLADCCSTVASLREDQDRLDDAAALLWRAVVSYAETPYQGERDKCLARIAAICLKQGDFGRAMTLLSELRSQSRWDSRAPGFAARIELCRAVCLAAAGLHEPARELLEESRELRARVRQPKERVPLEWLACRIAIRLGDLETAIPLLEAIRRRFLSEKKLVEVCLCSIDLAWAHARAGGLTERLPGLLQDIAQLPGATEPVWPLGALWRFREAVETQGAEPETAAREAADVVRRRESSLAKLAVESPPACGGKASRRMPEGG